MFPTCADDGGENCWKFENGVCTECDLEDKTEYMIWEIWKFGMNLKWKKFELKLMQISMKNRSNYENVCVSVYGVNSINWSLLLKHSNQNEVTAINYWIN